MTSTSTTERRLNVPFWVIVTRLLGIPAALLHRLALWAAPGFAKTFFGSDAFNRNTARYVWCANQFGHFALGVVAAAGPGHVIARLDGSLPLFPVLTCGLLFLLFYVLKEVADGLIEVDDKLPFQLDEFELGRDSLTDTAFVTLGIAAAVIWTFFAPDAAGSLNSYWALLPGAVALATACYCVWVGSQVLPCRDRLDESALPGFARLRRFNGGIEAEVIGTLAGDAAPGRRKTDDENSAEAARQVERFIDGLRGVLIIVANPGMSGRTFLATGVGCELAERRRGIRYVTWRSLEQRTFDDDQGEALPLARAEAVIVDDVLGSLDETVKLLRSCGCKAQHLVIVAEKKLDPDLAAPREQRQALSSQTDQAVLLVRIVRGLRVRKAQQPVPMFAWRSRRVIPASAEIASLS